MRKKRQHFTRGDEINLSFGAVIVPIIRTVKSPIEPPAFIEYLERVRWTRCKHQGKCIDAAEDFDGFSCEICPLRGRAENVRVITEDEAAYEADSCARLLSAAFQEV